MSGNPQFRHLKQVIASTFPDIHWEVYHWQKYTGRPDVWEEGKTVLFYCGFVDGWKYGLPAFRAPETASEQEVIDALEDQIQAWWDKQNPGFIGRITRAVSAALRNHEEGQ